MARREKEKKENKQNEPELKGKKNKKEEYYLSSPQDTPYCPSGFDDNTLTPTLTDTLVPAPETESDKGQKKKKTLRTGQKLTTRQNTIQLI